MKFERILADNGAAAAALGKTDRRRIGKNCQRTWRNAGSNFLLKGNALQFEAKKGWRILVRRSPACRPKLVRRLGEGGLRQHHRFSDWSGRPSFALSFASSYGRSFADTTSFKYFGCYSTGRGDPTALLRELRGVWRKIMVPPDV